jgi:hypothetical protein
LRARKFGNKFVASSSILLSNEEMNDVSLADKSESGMLDAISLELDNLDSSSEKQTS